MSIVQHRLVVGRTEQDSVDVEFFPLGLLTWNILNDTCVHLNDNQAIKTKTPTNIETTTKIMHLHRWNPLNDNQSMFVMTSRMSFSSTRFFMQQMASFFAI